MVERLVSVIIPIYNIPVQYIEECVQSILRQTYDCFELLLVDDGSADVCREYCSHLPNKDSRIHVILQENQGVSVARNTGLKNAKGEFIAFIDADDYIEKDYFEYLLSLINGHCADIAVCDYDFIYKNGIAKSGNKRLGNLISYNTNQALQQILLRKAFGCSSASRMYKREIISDISFPVDVKNGEDINFSWNVFKNAKRVVFSPEIKYHYRQRAGSAVHSLYNNDRSSVINVVREIKDECCTYYSDLYPDAVYRYAQAVLEVVEHSNWDNKMKQFKSEIRNNFIILVKSGNVTKEFKFAIIVSSISLRIYRVIKNLVNKYREETKYYLFE